MQKNNKLRRIILVKTRKNVLIIHSIVTTGRQQSNNLETTTNLITYRLEDFTLKTEVSGISFEGRNLEFGKPR